MPVALTNIAQAALVFIADCFFTMTDPVNAAKPPAHSHNEKEASSWVKRWSHLVKPGGRVLDVACGHGRHALWFHQLKHPVVVVDRSQDAVDGIAIAASACKKIVADIENRPWPLAGQQFDAVVVTNYLWRPLFPALLASLAPGGVLMYETFAIGNETLGKPSNPQFLLRPGELLEVCQNLRIVGFEDGFLSLTNNAAARFVQRIAAVKMPAATPEPVRYLLA